MFGSPCFLRFAPGPDCTVRARSNDRRLSAGWHAIGPQSPPIGVMAGLVPAIYVLLAEVPQERRGCPRRRGPPPRDPAGCHCAGMTLERWFDLVGTRTDARPLAGHFLL